MKPAQVMINHSPVHEYSPPSFMDSMSVEVDKRGHVTYTVIVNTIEDYELAMELGVREVTTDMNCEDSFSATVKLLVEEYDTYAHQTLDGTSKMEVKDVKPGAIVFKDIDTHWQQKVTHPEFIEDFFGQTWVPWTRHYQDRHDHC